MTNEELIAKIKEEINYRIETYIGNAQSCVGSTRVDGLEEVSDFLSDLEKSLHTKVKDNDKLEEEILNWILAHIEGGEEGTWKKLRDVCTEWGCKIARHFYDLGCYRTEEKYAELEYNRQRESENVPEDLNAYAQSVEDYYDVSEERGYLYTHRGDIKDAVIAGAKWQANRFAECGAEHLKK